MKGRKEPEFPTPKCFCKATGESRFDCCALGCDQRTLTEMQFKQG